MNHSKSIQVCKSCGFSGKGNYCSQCGQYYKIKRISLTGLLQDIFHFFTHLESGFFYTLKQLIIKPGYMQREYVEGVRHKHQTPFSMFFICGTIAALLRYWILNYLMTTFHSADPVEVKFYKEYMVLLYIMLIPVYAVVAYLLFYKSGYNYTEMIVLLLYTLSVIFLVSPLLFLLLLKWPFIDVMYIEFVIYSFYFAITFVNFFKTYSRWKAILLSILCLAIAFFINQMAESLAMKLLYKS